MTDFGPAICMKWNDEAQVLMPINDRWARAASRQLVHGDAYMIREHAERSGESHRHHFACIREAWLNLPEQHCGLPYSYSPEHLRKYALIRTGYCDTQSFVCGSKAEAERWAANIRPMDEFSLVTVQECLVVRQTAQSQSKKAMGSHVFQESKQAVLEFLAGMIGCSVDQLAANSKKAA